MTWYQKQPIYINTCLIDCATQNVGENKYQIIIIIQQIEVTERRCPISWYLLIGSLIAANLSG